MAKYATLLSKLRDKYVEQVDVTVHLPPIKTLCPNTDESLTMLNSPADYCELCNNTGYIITDVSHVVPCVVLDYAPNALGYSFAIEQSQTFTYDKQLYVLHADATACFSDTYPDHNCFDIAKEVTLDNVSYLILGLDKSRMFDQVRVLVGRKN